MKKAKLFQFLKKHDKIQENLTTLHVVRVCARLTDPSDQPCQQKDYVTYRFLPRIDLLSNQSKTLN